LRRPQTFREYAKRRTAAYARVSTDSDEQMNSYYAQVDYYTKYIHSNDEWEFAGIYTDEGITGTNTKRRKGFKELVVDALAGKVDLIVTKSVARFARNTVDTLSTVRQLKEHGVEVYFEKENIWTFDGKGELLLTIMSSLAQEESRSISENVTWGQRKRMADGKVTMPYKRFLGYAKGENGEPVVVEEEAETVRFIYGAFLAGYSFREIANQLTTSDALSPGGSQKWSVSTVKSILQNEKYKGDALLQKSFTVDFLTKKTKVNEGEVPQYYVENSHPAIIDPATFDLVQSEIERRRTTGNHPIKDNPFSGKIICGECGGYYGSKVWHSSSKYRRVVWQCNEKYKAKGGAIGKTDRIGVIDGKTVVGKNTVSKQSKHANCNTPHLYEQTIKAAFVKALNRLIEDKDQYLADYEAVVTDVFGATELDSAITSLQDECAVVMELIRKCVADNAKVAQDQGEYEKRYNRLVERHETAKTKLDKLQSDKAELAAKNTKIQRFMDDLKVLVDVTGNLVTEFDENLWRTLIENVTVDSSGDMLFKFKDGSTMLVQAKQ